MEWSMEWSMELNPMGSVRPTPSWSSSTRTRTRSVTALIPAGASSVERGEGHRPLMTALRVPIEIRSPSCPPPASHLPP